MCNYAPIRKTQEGCGAVSEEKIQERSRRRVRFPAAIFLAGKCPNLSRDSICRAARKPVQKTFPAAPNFGFGKRGLLEKGSFQKSPFSRDSREFRDSRDFREPLDCGKQRRVRPFSRDSREFRDFRDSRDSSSQKTPFVMTPFSGPENSLPEESFFQQGIS